MEAGGGERRDTEGEKEMMSDRDAFSLVLLLLWLEGELNEELLQLLVTVVDTELLKAATHNNKHNGWIRKKDWLSGCGLIFN